MGKHFQQISTGIDVQPLLSAIESKPHLWTQLTDRQTTPGSPHVDTETIILRWPKDQSVSAAFNEIPAIPYPALVELPEAYKLIGEVIQATDAFEIGRAIIVKFEAGGFIPPHADEGAYADHFERFHIPLQSDIGNLFMCGDFDKNFEAVHMDVGSLWTFNHKKTHWLFNGSDSARIHLIVDCVAPQYRKEREA